MSQSHQFIQEIGDQEASINPSSALQGVTKRCLRSDFFSELDMFSAPVKLNIGGSDVSQTKLGGTVYIAVIAICIWLTWKTFYGDTGFSPKSIITETIFKSQVGDDGTTIFDHFDQPIRFQFENKTTKKNLTIDKNITIYAYQIIMNEKGQNTTRKLEVTQGAQCIESEFCIRKSGNEGAAIWGDYALIDYADNSTYDPHFKYVPNSRIYLQMYWCDQSIAECLSPKLFTYKVYVSRLFEGKNNRPIVTDDFAVWSLGGSMYQHYMNISKVGYQTNYKITGHLANVFSSTYKSLRWNRLKQTIEYVDPLSYQFVSGPPPDWTSAFWFVSSGQTILATERFDDLSLPLLFFLSVKETFYFLVVFLLVSRYNQNSNFLKISDSLYTMQDHASAQKYEFNSNPYVILACFLYNHPINLLFDFILQCRGRNFYEFLPRKTFYTLMMISQAQKLLSENSFFGALEQLSSLQDQPPKKVKLEDEYEEKTKGKPKDEPVKENELDYFPESEVKREAFKQFCNANNFISAERKNHIYKILASRNLQLSLPELLKKQFSYYVQDVSMKVNDGRVVLTHTDRSFIVPAINNVQSGIPKKKQFQEEIDRLNDDSESNIKMIRKTNLKSSQSIHEKKSQKSEKSIKRRVSKQSHVEMKQLEQINYKQEGNEKFSYQHTHNENKEIQENNENAGELQSFSDFD